MDFMKIILPICLILCVSLLADAVKISPTARDLGVYSDRDEKSDSESKALVQLVDTIIQFSYSMNKKSSGTYVGFSVKIPTLTG
jgi:hypothetical protein